MQQMSLGTILLIILVLLLIGALPAWPYSAAWGPAQLCARAIGAVGLDKPDRPFSFASF
jgi:hypothetical protein